VLKAGLFSLPDDKIIDLRIFAGIKDTLEIFADRAGKSAPLQLGKIRYDLAEATSSKLTLSEMKSYLEKLSAAASEVTAEINVSESDPDSPMRYWARAFADQCLSALDELLFFAPWIFDPQFSEIIREIPRLNELITLRELSNFQEEFHSSIEEK